jgi:predicted aldo/keto reductase-like oxidoreductase
MPCPQKLNIPWLISYRNEWTLYANNPKMKLNYKAEFASDVRASACTHCKQCETKCPQHLPISGIMTEAQEIFE